MPLKSRLLTNVKTLTPVAKAKSRVGVGKELSNQANTKYGCKPMSHWHRFQGFTKVVCYMHILTWLFRKPFRYFSAGIENGLIIEVIKFPTATDCQNQLLIFLVMSEHTIFKSSTHSVPIHTAPRSPIYLACASFNVRIYALRSP